jgi:hypothetical protein
MQYGIPENTGPIGGGGGYTDSGGYGGGYTSGGYDNGDYSSETIKSA